MSTSLKTLLAAGALCVATAGAVFAFSTPAPRPAAPASPVAATPLQVVASTPPRIEAVFVLDTTGSMSGLIHAAKENIWSIASSMAQAQPTPELAIGLVAFRDRGDDYVTRVIDLSTDLDGVYAQLMDFSAGGGGDGPESVHRALHDAVQRIGWSERQDVYRTIFLVGDAPPHDYQDEPNAGQILQSALARGIVVNTIQAGSDSVTRLRWQQIAQLAGGKYFDVAQDGSAVAVATPYDDKLAALSRELDATRLFYGDDAARRKAAEKQASAAKVHAAASPAAQARRAEFNVSEAGSANLLGEDELVDAVDSGKVELQAIPVAALPAPLAALSVTERREKVEQLAERRRELQQEIGALAAQRQAHIADTLADADGSRDSLDVRLFETVKAQAEGKGLRYDGEVPVH